MVNFSDSSDLRRGYKASLRDFWDKEIPRRIAESPRSKVMMSPFRYQLAMENQSAPLYLSCRPLKLSYNTRCTILTDLSQEDNPSSTFGLFKNGAAKLLN